MISGAPLETGAGIEKFIKILITQKELTKFDFTLVFPYFNKEDINERKDIPNLTYFPIKIPFPLERKITKTFNSIIFNFTLIFYYFYRLKNCIEVIHINGVNGALLSLFARKKCVFTIHGNSLDSFTNTRFKKINIASITQFLNFLYFFALENLAYLLSNKVITVSKQSMKHFLLFHKREYTYIPIGIEARLDAIDIEERN